MKLKLLLLLLLMLQAGRATAMSTADARALLALIDRRTTHTFDYKALVFVESNEKNKETTLFKALVYRRDKHDALMILFTAPKSQRGSGYLRLKRNLWYYEPKIGKWDRRTDRERIGGTGSNRKDFDKSTMARDYDPVHKGQARLGKYTTDVLELTQKKGRRPTYPRMKIWVDRASKNLLKRQEFGASGKLLRTAFFPRWAVIEHNGVQIWFPRQVRIFDEVVKGSVTTVVPKKVIPSKLPANIFTKAWLESKSR